MLYVLRWSSSILSRFVFNRIDIGDSCVLLFEVYVSFRLVDGYLSCRYLTHLPFEFFKIFPFGVLELDEGCDEVFDTCVDDYDIRGPYFLFLCCYSTPICASSIWICVFPYLIIFRYVIIGFGAPGLCTYLSLYA